jgi:hypothetical protein
MSKGADMILPALPMASYKFHVGEIVSLRPVVGRNVPSGAYEVTKLLPHNGREFEYRIKSAARKTGASANGPSADACGFADGLRRLTAHNLPYNSLSTVRGQTGILVHVHPVLPWNLKSQQPQLPRSEPDGQPTESSHLARIQGQSEQSLKTLRRESFLQRTIPGGMEQRSNHPLSLLSARLRAVAVRAV